MSPSNGDFSPLTLTCLFSGFRVEAIEEMKKLELRKPNLTLRLSFVCKKTNPRWLWHAVDRNSGQVLAYVFGRRKDEMDGELMNGIFQLSFMR